MQKSYIDRAEEMLFTADAGELEACSLQLETWVNGHALEIREMGDTRMTRAVATTFRTPGYRLESEFCGERRDLYVVHLHADGSGQLGNTDFASVGDLCATHHAMAALLDELGMAAMLG